MTHDAREITNWFIQRAHKDGQTFAITKLLKLIYIAHGWYLGTFRTPLFENRVEAWRFGPVVPDVYSTYRDQGKETTHAIEKYRGEFTSKETELLERIYNEYGALNSFRLSALTHEPGGPWDIILNRYGYFSKIPNTLIKQHYSKKFFELKLANCK